MVTKLTKGTQVASRNATPGPSKHLKSSKQLVPITDVLRPPPPASPTVPRIAPLTLSDPAMVEKHFFDLAFGPSSSRACVSVISPYCQRLKGCILLLYATISPPFPSAEWTTNKWWMFDQLVDSPHKTSLYARKVDGASGDGSWQEAAQYWRLCQLIQKVVNEALESRSRYSLEWCGTGTRGQSWKATVAEGAAFHSDQLTYLGPFPTIASLSLATTRIFRLREVSEVENRRAQTYNIPVLRIMHASTQERYKHTILPQRAIDVFQPSFPSHLGPDVEDENGTCRINITIRFYRPDFRPPIILDDDMKGETMQYFWTCCAGAQNDGKGCPFIGVMDAKSEGRDHFNGDRKSPDSSSLTT
ncbi:hypothetical protein JB92DRAFT_3086158 [Gautieria morchelliformis]|nr:hypothetical protein JB92DRAFT_3086158 [Gautieria morchelliformis]